MMILADDLSGACDAAIAFANRGMPTRVLMEPATKIPKYSQVCAISTGTRDLPWTEAEDILSRAIREAQLSTHLRSELP